MKDPDPEQVADAVSSLYAEMRGVRARDAEADTVSQTPRASRSTPRVSPVKRYVHSLGDDLMTVGEVADELGVSASYIRNLEPITNTPSLSAPFGKYRVRIYTPEDVEVLRAEVNRRMGGLEQR